MKPVKFSVETDVEKLHRKSLPVNMNGYDPVRLSKILRDAFNKLDGKLQGISAIQCGYAEQAVLLRYVKGEEPIVIFNPVVLKSVGSKKSNEGCLSEGNNRYIVKRPLFVKVQYDTIAKDCVIEWLPYSKARIFMHEYDHLRGVLLQDVGKKVEV